MEVQPDGAILATMNTPDLNWAASTVMAYGPLVKVLEPPELQELVREWAQATVAKYIDR